MKIAEQVTFGGSGLDRAAQLRGDSAALDALRADPTTKATVIWRGKPLFCGEDRANVAWLPMDHAVFAQAGTEVFLGFDEEGARFAYDLSAWQPDEMPDSLNQFLDPSEQIHPALPQDHVFAELRVTMTRITPRDAELIASAKGILAWHAGHGFCARCGQASISCMAGWQRDCEACGAHHFPRTDPVVIMLITNGNSVLMGRSPGWPEGMYSLLAGFVEPGETIEGAVRREVFEEAGVRVGEVGYLSSQPWPFPASLMFGCWGHAISKEIKIDPSEIEDARWVTREEMMDVFAGNSATMNAPRKGAIAHFLTWNWLKDQLD